MTSATESRDWTQNFSYDQTGNRAVSGYMPNAGSTPQASSAYNTNNQWTGAGYDASGNQKVLPSGSFTYDAENRVTSATESNMPSILYSYDGDGRRVTKTVGAVTTTYVYDAGGQLAAEYSNTAPNYTGPLFLTTDHLGSTRLVTDSTGAVKQCFDYLPFGEEIAAGTFGRGSCFPSGMYPINPSPDVLAEKFTGKERDAETGLDYFGARYFSGAQGRFSSPDPFLNSGRPDNPQSWDRYAYVSNNPLRYTDPLGLYQWAVACDEGKDAQCHASRQRFRDALNRLKDARDRYDPKSDEYKKLDRAWNAYGTEKAVDTVQISFDTRPGSPGGTGQPADGHITVRFDDKTFTALNQRDLGVSYAATVGHEGWHVATYLSGQLLPPQQYPAYFNNEFQAYQTESFVNRAFRTDSAIGIWNNAWFELDKHRDEYKRALERQATDSARHDCSTDRGCKAPR